jgi:microcystin-dependent protein
LSRVKTFDSTGVAPNGVFFAGDANSIQDHYADLSNYAQTVDIGTLRVAESGLQFVRHATSPLEARVTAALRADGILRGLSGLFAGTYTTAQRDAIALGSRPYGLIILNTTTNQLEINLGTDATPAWTTVGANALPIGTILPFTGSEGSVPAGFGLCDGATVSRTTFSALNALYSAQSYPFGTGDGSTTFNKPDLRGRTLIARDNMGGTAASRAPGVTSMGAAGGTSTETLDISKIPSHSHGGVTGNASPGTGTESVGHTHTYSGTTSTGGTHDHSLGNNNNLYMGNFASTTAALGSGGTARYVASNVYSLVDADGAHNHTFSGTTSGASLGHTHTVNAHGHSITAEGGGAAHNNLQPYIAVNYIVKLT